MRLLLVEDDTLLGKGLKAGLKQAGYQVEWLQRGDQATTAIESNQFDIIVLDIMLPGESGMDILRKMRRRGDATPVLLLTARDSINDRVEGLDSGADDYLVKPFDLDELNARLRALLRRRSGRAEPILEHRGIMMDPAAHRVEFNGDEVNLSSREFALLQYLLENAGRAITRTRLEETLYGWDGEVESNSLEVFIHHLRKKLGSDLIRTIRGVGYMIE